MVNCWCSIVIAPPLLLLRWWSSSIVVWVVILLWHIFDCGPRFVFLQLYSSSHSAYSLQQMSQFELENLHKEFNKINKEVSKLKHLIKESEETKKSIADKEANNVVVRSWGEKRVEPKLKNHVDLVKLLEIADTNKGADVAGGRGFHLK
ncbi:hypothetical protein Fmac_008993 [Flemingia macrophylla]|uniref:Uncharacterized protein n=1 Tax=Flemingia macrophylla TaxID=520843 RepID=A0ABD1MZ13_9FABA